jgi:two-component system KDP operon response regulator KdpE
VRIVLIEDQERLLDVLAMVVRFRWPDADILTATEGETGLWLALEGSTDLVVLDVGLPDRNGFDVLAEIRRTSDVPVILLTGSKDETDQVRGLDLGADAYLTKPVGNMALLAHINAVLRRVQPTTGRSLAEYVGGSLRVDQARRELIGTDGRVRLTPIESRLLSCLNRNSGAVVSRPTLIRRGWGHEDAVSPHDLNVFMARLRVKLVQVGGGHEIVTERGVGYRVVTS